MYRLSRFSQLTRELTGELINGFQFILGLPKSNRTIVWDDESLTCIKTLFRETPFDFENLTNEQKELLKAKITRMYEELFDQEYAYTFDPFGEYILSLMINDARNFYTYFLEIGWDSTINPLILPELYDTAYQMLEAGECRRYEDEHDEEKNTNEYSAFLMVRDLTMFPFLLDETITGSPIIQNRDFEAREAITPEDIQELFRNMAADHNKAKNAPEAYQDRDLISGSTRVRIEKETD